MWKLNKEFIFQLLETLVSSLKNIKLKKEPSQSFKIKILKKLVVLMKKWKPPNTRKDVCNLHAINEKMQGEMKKYNL
jgi:hypothetical protein